MVDIEPYQYQKTTNVKEHNDIVAKINEIVDVINNTNLDTVLPRISKLETDVNEITANDSVQDNNISTLNTKTAKLEQDISGINATDSLQWSDIESVKTDIGTINPKIAKLEQDVTDINSTDAVQNTDISNLKTKDSEHDNHIRTIDTEINGITKSLVSDVAILSGTTSGNVKVRIGRNDAPSIDSDDYNIQKPTSVELVQGSAPAMVKAQITLSDGTVLISDDFMFTTEAIGQDVYISSFVFKNGNVAGSISADIGLSNGSTLEANNFVVPTDPNVTSAISDIQGRVTTVENDVSGLKTTVNGHTTAINGLNTDVSGLKTTVNGHTTAINGLNTDVSGLKTTVNKHTTSINALDSDVANLQIDKADADNSSQTIVAGSISATNITKGGVSVATINDISGKVNIAQGTANAGKVLGINASGNVEPTEISSGGETWKEVDLSNFPTDWVEDERIKVAFKIYYTDGASKINTDTKARTPIIEFTLCSTFTPMYQCIYALKPNQGLYIGNMGGASFFNSNYLFTVSAYNSNNTSIQDLEINRTNASTYIYKMWRLKK